MTNKTPTILKSTSSNWVDRGEAPNATVRRVLANHFRRQDPAWQEWLEEQAATIIAMVAADSTEVHIAGYLRFLAEDQQIDTGDPREYRRTAIAVWHIAKAALVRDFAERVLRGEIPVNAPTADSFSHFIASRLLSPEELERFEAESQGDEEP